MKDGKSRWGILILATFALAPLCLGSPCGILLTPLWAEEDTTRILLDVKRLKKRP